MSNLVVSEFITVDGVIEDPGGSEGTAQGGWAFNFNRGPEGDKFKFDEVMTAGALLLGRVTYEGFAAAWPERTDEAGFADKFNSMPKYVASRTLRDPQWANSHVIEGELREAVLALKQEVRGDLLVNGSADLCRELLGSGLVDELRLMVFPVLLGSGKRLFEAGTKAVSLRMHESTPAGDTLIVRYGPR